MTETRSADENYSVVEPWPCARNWTVLVAEVAIDCESTPSSLSSVRSRRTEASADSSYAACERCPTSGHCSAPPTTSSSSSAEQRRPIPSRHPARGWLLAGQPSEQCPQALPLLRSPEPLPGHPPSCAFSRESNAASISSRTVCISSLLKSAILTPHPPTARLHQN